MFERYLKFIALAECPHATEDEAFARFQNSFSKKQTRRMSRLGILIAHVLKDAPIDGSPLLYATNFTESRALEKYLDSFPDASPTQFQTSIHPGGIEQALILAQQPVQELIPLAGGDTLVFAALQQMFLFDAEEVALVGGEESGTWLLDMNLASTQQFAFSAIFSISPIPDSLKISWNPEDGKSTPRGADLLTLARTLARKETCTLSHPDFGSFSFKTHCKI